MPQGLQAVLALLLLLPGFISARIVRLLTPRNQQSELERVIEALTFSFLVYVAYFFFFGGALPLEWKITQTAGSIQFQLIPHRIRILWVLVLAIVLGLSWGIVKSRDWLLKVLRKWNVTERTSRESVWNDVFLSFSGTVQVGLADGRMVIGWLRRYSETNDERSLFVEKASWVSEDGELIPIDGEGLLLTEKAEIHFVMFLGDPDRPAAELLPPDL